MFGLNKYVHMLYKIQWKFKPEQQKDLEDLLFVTFKQNEKGYFMIESVSYTYIDILTGLEEVDFVLSKVQNEFIIELV